MLTESIDDLIREARREMARLSTERDDEIARTVTRIKEKYAREMETYADSITHLEAVKANHSSHAQKRLKSQNGVQARNRSGSGKFPVTEEVRGIVREMHGLYSLEDI